MNNKVTKIFLKLIFLFLLTWGSIALFYVIDPYRAADTKITYNAAIIDKYARLKSLKSPKIVLIAGSNFAYGINSEMIEKAFNRPVVNMALHYSFGTDFMLKQIAPHLHKGDTVIMGFEYIITRDGDFDEKMQMTRLFPEARKWIHYKDIFEYIGENAQLRITVFKNGWKRMFEEKPIIPKIADTSSVFFREGINKYGDLVSHLNNPILKKIPRALIGNDSNFDEVAINMNQFYEKMRAKGVEVYYTYPSYAQSSYKFDAKIIEKLDTQLKKNSDFPILGQPTDFVFADSLCQDMVYHLNRQGRDIRTQRLINLLKNYKK